MPITTLNIVTAAAALIAVLALVLLAGRVARAGGFAPRLTSGARRLAVEESAAIDARRRLHLVRCDGRSVLLLTGGAQDLVLGWLPSAQERAP